MKIITRHLTAQIGKATALVIFALIGLFLFFDLVGQADNIGTRYSLLQALMVTGFSIPSRLYEVMPIAVLLGSVYTMSRWAANSEFTILRVAGMSPQAFVKSLLVPGLLFVLLTYGIGEVIAPYSSQLRQDAELRFTNRMITSKLDTGVWARDQVYDSSQKLALSRYVNVKNLSSGSATGANDWRVYEFSPENELRRTIEAPSGVYDEQRGWLLKDAVVTEFPALAGLPENAAPENIRRHTEKELLLQTSLAPRILSVMVSTPEQMSVYDLGSYIEHMKINHEETGKYEIAFWKKVFYPLSVLVMLALSMPFAYLSTRAGGVSIKIFGGVMIGIVFYALNSLFSYIGVLSSIPPVIAAIFPTLAALILAALSIFYVERR